MNIEVVREVEGLQELAEEWRELLTKVPQATPFQTPEFQLAWWKHLGGGEWENGQLYVITGRNEAGDLAGIAPLFQPGGDGAEEKLLLLGSHEIADYLDFIAPTEIIPAFIHNVFDRLEAEKTLAWKHLDLYNLPETSGSLPLLKEAAHSRGWGYQKNPLQVAPMIPLPETWEAYLTALPKKQRHEVRRKMRRAANYLPTAELHIADSEEEAAEMFETLLTFMRENDQKRAFLSEIMERQLSAIVEAGWEYGWLQLSELRSGRETAAVELNFDYRETVWAYNSGTRASFREISPGVVLHALLIQQAIEQGRTSYDFMRGDEEYKFRMGAQPKQVKRVVISKG